MLTLKACSSVLTYGVSIPLGPLDVVATVVPCREASCCRQVAALHSDYHYMEGLHCTVFSVGPTLLRLSTT